MPDAGRTAVSTHFHQSEVLKAGTHSNPPPEAPSTLLHPRALRSPPPPSYLSDSGATGRGQGGALLPAGSVEVHGYTPHSSEG